MPLAESAGHAPTPSNTAPAGSREKAQLGTGMRPADERRRTSAMVARCAELGLPMRRNDARRVVLAYADRMDQTADGWNAWLQRQFDPTQAAALANLDGGGGNG